MIELKYKYYLCLFISLILFLSVSACSRSEEGENDFEKGLSYYNEGNCDESLKIFLNLIKGQSPDSSYFYYTGASYQGQKNYDRAIEYYKEFLMKDNINDFLKTKAHYGMGTSYRLKGDYENAIKEFEITIELDPLYKPVSYYGMATAYQDSYNYPAAIEYHQKALQALSDKEWFQINSSVLENLKTVITDNEKFEAIKSLKSIYVIPGKELIEKLKNAGLKEEEIQSVLIYGDCTFSILNLIRFDLGYSYFFNEDYELAIKELAGIIENDPYNYNAYYYTGSSYEAIGDYKKAIEYYKKAVELTDNSDNLAEYTFRIAYCYALLDNYNMAVEYNIKANSYKKNPLAYHNLGVLYEQKEDLEGAIKTYKEYIEFFPEAPDRSVFEKKIKELERTLRINSGDGTHEDYITRGRDLYNRSEYEEALKLLKKAPEGAEIHYIMGLCYDDQEKIEEALKEYGKAIELEPQKFSPYFKSGLIYFYEKNYKQARDFFIKALDRGISQEEKGDASFYAGQCCFAIKDYEGAVKCYKETLKASPEEGLPYYNIAQALLNEGKLSESLTYYKNYIIFAPDGEYAKEAIERIYEALQKDPKSITANLALGEIYSEENDYNKAAYHYLSVLETDPYNSSAGHKLAELYEAEGRYSDAMAIYKENLKNELSDEDMLAMEDNMTRVSSNIQAAILDVPEETGCDRNEIFIKIVEPAYLIGQKNLIIEENNPQITSVKLTGIVSSHNEIKEIEINGEGLEILEASPKNLEIIPAGRYKKEFTKTINLSEGENIIKVKVLDSQNNTAEEEVVINYNPSNNIEIDTSPAVKREKWAVVIGIGKFQDPRINTLDYTVPDAEAIYNFLTEDGGFSPDHVKLLLNDEATTKNVKSALGIFLSRKARKDDTVFIYYSGHGAPEIDPSSPDGVSKYIVTYDADPHELYATAFPMEEVQKIFQRIKSERIAFFIDSCYSGASGGKTFSKPGSKVEGVSAAFLEEAAEGKGRILITASGVEELSLELPEFGHGIFTYFLLEALEGEADKNSDKMITIEETFNYVYDKVVKTSEKFGGSQHPMKKGESSGKFVLINL